MIRMSGRGRGRGALARWEASKIGGLTSSHVGSSAPAAVIPLSPKENWEDEIKQKPEDTTKNDRHIRITHIIDVENFWAQIGSVDELKQFDTYMTALNSWCNEQQQSSVQQVPVYGQAVCVWHRDTSQWRRAQITRLSNSMVDVIYLDYGQSECVSLNRLCNSTPGDILSRQAMAQYINLEGVRPVGENWSAEANKRFSELVSSSGKLVINFSDNIRGKLYLRETSGQKVSVSDILISEGLAQSSDGDVAGGSWEKEGSHKTKLSHSEQQKRLDQQWDTLTFQPATAQQPSWKTSSIVNADRNDDHFSMGRNVFSGSAFSSIEQSSQGRTSFQNKIISPPKTYHNESKLDLKDISLNNVPLPPCGPDLFMQSKESDNLETFNIKRAESGPVESLHLARPHLASPKDFLSHSRGQDTGIPSVLPKSDALPKYQPPHIRNAQTKMSDTAVMNKEHKLDNITALPQSNNPFLPLHDQQPPFSNFAFSPKPGRSHIAAQFQSNFVNKEDVPLNSQLPQKQTLQFQQPEFLKIQPLNENSRDKKLKAELDWKIWKFQRNVKKVLDKMTAESNTEDYSHDFSKIIAESRLSQEFQGISEVSVILKLLLEKVMDGNTFDSVAVKVCTIFEDMCIPEFGDLLNKVVTQCQKQLMEQCSASDCHKRCQRFSSFLGKLYLEGLTDVDPKGLKSSVDGIVANSLHNWLSFDQSESVDIHMLNAVCLKSFLKVTGATIDQTEGNEISRYFRTIRDLVLSQDLAVPVKSTLLDILLLRASGWKVEEDSDEQETGIQFTESEVFIEDDVTEEQQPEGTGDQDDDEEWDPYSKVKSMLKNLKLQDLLPKFFDNCIRDSLLTADWEELKRTLQEAGFPPGVILEIRMYLDKGLLEKDIKKTSRPGTNKKDASSTNLIQELQRPSNSPTPTKSLEQNIEINKLNQELQQLMFSGNQDKGGSRISPTKKISPSKELTGHDGTPYSRGGPRKFVSRTERRLSSENVKEDLGYTVTIPSSDPPEKTPTQVEPVNVSTSVETSSEPSKPVSSMSYSAVLKNLSSEATRGVPASSKPPNQSKTFSRPPPGFAPLPTHGGDTEMHMTVLSTKSKTKPSAAASSAPRNNHTRADASMNWRSDEPSTQSNVRQQPTNSAPQSGKAVKWRRFEDSPQSKPPRTGPLNEGGQRRDTPAAASGYASSDESPEPPPVVQPHRTFGPGGLKACVICGSKEHLRCNDRSKIFLD